MNRSIEVDGFHPDNRHQGNYPFDELALSLPEFAAHLNPKEKGNGKLIDFSDPVAIRSLNKALLWHYYAINDWQIPEGYLCPTVPSRADYLHHVKGLISTTSGPSSCTSMLDVGTGANGIYTLLAASMFNWQVIACDVNPLALESLRTTIGSNPHIATNIELRLQANRAHIFEGVIGPGDKLSLTVCNPPFYDSNSSAKRAHIKKHKAHLKRSLSSDPNNRTTAGTHDELWCSGGEVAFVRKMIKESRKFKEQVTWFTTLISRQSTLNLLEDQLHEVSPTHIRIIPMKHGNKISRILAWRY